MSYRRLGAVGFEHHAKTPEKPGTPEDGGALSGAVRVAARSAETGPALPADLAEVAAAWGDLPPPIRSAVLALVRTAAGPTD